MRDGAIFMTESAAIVQYLATRYAPDDLVVSVDGHVDRALQSGDWLCAGRFTAADISVGYALLLANHLKLAERFTPAVTDYWLRISSRQAFQEAKRIQKRDLATEIAAFLS